MHFAFQSKYAIGGKQIWEYCDYEVVQLIGRYRNRRKGAKPDEDTEEIVQVYNFLGISVEVSKYVINCLFS